MSERIVIPADSHETAFQFREKIADMAGDFSVQTEDVIVVTRDDGGAVKPHPLTNPVAMLTIGGTVLGLGLGAMFLMLLACAAVGVAAGAPRAGAQRRDRGWIP